MSRVLDRLAIRAATALGLDPCVVVAWVAWVLCWCPEVRAVRREILRRVIQERKSAALVEVSTETLAETSTAPTVWHQTRPSP